MSLDTNEVIPGIDPTPLTQISASQLYQLVAALTYTPTRGPLLWSDETPDVTQNPAFKRGIWLKPSEQGKVHRTYNESTSSWEANDAGDLSVGTDQLQDASVTLAKLYNPNDASKAGYYLKVNSSGNGWVIEAFSLSDNSIELVKLNKGSGNANKLPHIKSDGSAWEFIDPDTLFNSISDASLSIAKLNPVGVLGAILITNPAGSSFTLLAPGVSGYVLRSSATGPYWSAETPQVVSGKSTSATASLPVGGGQVAIGHQFTGSIPQIVKVVLVNTSTDAGYAVGDEVDAHSFFFGGGDGYPIGVSVDTTSVYVSFTADTLGVANKNGTSVDTVTRSKWSIKVYAVKF